MKTTERKIVYDEILKSEAFHLEGIFQPFPNHFHEYYVIGLIEKGKRKLFCKGREYLAVEGDILVFHPGDNHSCMQEDEEELDYRGLNIPKDTMTALVQELTGKAGQGRPNRGLHPLQSTGAGRPLPATAE